MTSNFRFAEGSSVTRFNPPGAYATVVNQITVITGDKTSYFYELNIADVFDWVKVPADVVHAQYMETPDALRQVADNAFDPPEPQDPNADQDGFPIYKPDHI
jgi:hypothetical protein